MPVFSFVGPNVIILIVFSFRNELMIQNKNRTRSFVCVFLLINRPGPSSCYITECIRFNGYSIHYTCIYVVIRIVLLLIDRRFSSLNVRL